MSRPEHATDAFDPFSQWQTLRDRTMDTWSKVMLDFVQSDEYATASARWLDSYLTLSTSFQGVMDQAMTQTLSQCKVPSTEDINRLAERMWNVELKLDDLDARMDAVIGLLKEVAARQAGPPPASAGPARPVDRTATRRPARAAARPVKAKPAPAPKLAEPKAQAAKSPTPGAPHVRTPGSTPVARETEPAPAIPNAAEPGKLTPSAGKAGNGGGGAVAASAKNGGVPATPHAAKGEKSSKGSGDKPAAADLAADPAGQEHK